MPTHVLTWVPPTVGYFCAIVKLRRRLWILNLEIWRCQPPVRGRQNSILVQDNAPYTDAQYINNLHFAWSRTNHVSPIPGQMGTVRRRNWNLVWGFHPLCHDSRVSPRSLSNTRSRLKEENIVQQSHYIRNIYIYFSIRNTLNIKLSL